MGRYIRTAGLLTALTAMSFGVLTSGAVRASGAAVDAPVPATCAAVAYRDDARGTSVEVLGDLCQATRIAVLVPGADTTFKTYERFRAGAVALSEATGPDVAVIAWLGYQTPKTISPQVLTWSRAETGAGALGTFVGQLRALRPDAGVALVCHSYGAVVCARAASTVEADDIVLYGSPGAGVPNTRSLDTEARVWAGRAGHDWIAKVPHFQLRLGFATIGFGTDPVAPAFGARVFAAGDGGHSDYLKPGSVPLRSIASIVTGGGAEA